MMSIILFTECQMLEYIYKFQLLLYDDSGFLVVELVKDEAVRSLV